MTAQQVHSKLKNDEAYQYSREHGDIINMKIVLRAYGFKNTLDHCLTMITFKPST